MKFFWPIILILFLILFKAGAQTKVDSLTALLDENPETETRLSLLNRLAYELSYADPETAIRYAEEAIKLGGQINSQSDVARAYRNLAIVQQNYGKYEEALVFSDSALRIFSLLNDSTGLASVYTTIGNISYYLADFPAATQNYEAAYHIYKNSGLYSRAAILINNVALVLNEMSNYREALKKYFEALALNDKTANDAGKALTLRNIGIVYFNLGNLDNAIEYYHLSLDICQKIGDQFGIAAAYSNIGNALGMKGEHQKTLPYFEKALDIFIEKGDLNSTAIVYSQIGHYLIEGGEEEQGFDYLLKSIAINEDIGNHHSLAYVLLEVALFQLKNGEYSQALGNLNRCRKIFEETGDVNMLSQTFEGLSRYHQQMGNHRQALDYFREFKTLQDSIFRIESDERIAAAEGRYESEKAKAENERLSKDNIKKELEARKHKQSRNVFIIAAFLILVAALALFYRNRVRKKMTALLEQKNRELAEKSSQIQSQKEKIEFQYNKLLELDEAKTRFFANISHEFRTPLTLIRGPLGDVLKSDEIQNISESGRFKLRLAHRNIRQLNNLIDQLLDLSKLKAGKLKLKTRKQDIVPYLKRTVNTFESAIPAHKSIKISFRSQAGQLLLYHDPEKMDQIFNNLISNAIKSIEQEGEIIVNLEVPVLNQDEESIEGEFVTITVADSGKGISKDDLPMIFDRFFRADDSGNQNESGTGIGLELTRDLVELHGGTISAESEPDKGSVFTIKLPIGKFHLEPEEIIEDAGESESIPVDEFINSPSRTAVSAADNEAAFTILIVEDHPDMQQYIRSHLEQEYKIREAENGKKALELIGKELPDLIVSDLMMPEMDGLSLLQELRKKASTAEIPFIMLTAKASEEDRLAGFRQKADAYITKPFQAGELLVRIRNLLERSAMMKEKYSKKVLAIELDNADIPTADQKFLQQLKKAVEENLSDPTFGIQQLTDKVFLSERQLRRKLNNLTGLTSVEFIRQIRLQQAKLLIEQHAYTTISEVAAAVGFNNPAYFTRLFNKMFGSSPQEIMKADSHYNIIPGYASGKTTPLL
jgi:signal transduction histidine kinase/DNA-binding response OmpR family regulator